MAATPQMTLAQTTWDGGGANGLFSNATNWVGDTLPPATGGQLVFAGSANLNPSNNSFITTLATSTGNTAFTFASGAGAFNISGTTITNGTTVGNTLLVDQNSAANQVISANLVFAGNQKDRNIRFGPGSGSITLAGNVDFKNDTIGIGVTTTSGAAGTLILTGTNSGDGKGAQISSGGNQMRAVFWTPQDNSRLVLGSDSALGNTNTGSVTTSNAVLKGVTVGRILYLSTTNGDRNLSGNSIGITGGRVEYDGANNLTIGNVINSGGNRDLWVSGAGTLTVSSGLFLSESSTVGRSLFFNVTNSAGNAVVNGQIYDTFHSTNALANVSTLRKGGNGTLALNGDSSATFSGTVQVEGGTLRLGNAGALGSTNASDFTSIRAGTLDLNGFSIGEKIYSDDDSATIANSSANAAAVTQDIGLSKNITFNNAGDVTTARLIAGATRTVTKSGVGVLTTAGTNHNSLVGWVINQGTVNFANTTGYGADRGVTINDGGTLKLSGTNNNLINDSQAFIVNTGGTFDLNGKSEAIAGIDGTGGTVRNGSTSLAKFYVGGGTSGTNNASWAGSIQDGTGVIDLTKEGTGTQTLTGVSTYTGTTTVTKGSLVLSGAGALSSSTALAVSNGATFDVGGRSQTFSGLSGAGSVTNASGTLTVNNAKGTNSFSGVISGGGALTKSGNGSLLLSGSNNYGGTTTVNDGTLVISNAIFTATILSNSVVVNFVNSPTNGTYPILPGALAANSLATQPEISGLGGGQNATVTNDPNLVVNVTSTVSAGPSFDTAYPGTPMTDVAPNGLTYLMNYALGGSSTTSASLPSQDTSDPTKLTLVAYVRTNNAVGTLLVVGEKGESLSNFDTANTIPGEIASDQSTAPAGTQKRIFSVPANGDRLFLRLKVTIEP